MVDHQSQTNIETLFEKYFGNKPNPGASFLEIGCWDGELISQTAWLERQLDWRGVCVDPFPRNFENRSCYVCNRAISRDGLPREFVKVSVDRRYGGDVSYFSGFRDSLKTHWALVTKYCDYEILTVETITMTELYKRFRLPEYIDFLSVDVEGSEVEIFESIDFYHMSYGMIVFEHNEDETTKQKIGAILTGHGYRLLESWRVDDVYIHPNLYKARLDLESGEK